MSNFPETRPGDIVLIDGKGIVPAAIKFLVRTVFGIKHPFSHVQIAIGNGQYVSADSGGVQIVSQPEGPLSAKRWVVARNRAIAAMPEDDVIQACCNYLGLGYDFYLYILWLLRVSIIFTPIYVLILWPIYGYMKRQEVKRHTCCEDVATILDDLGQGIGVDDPTNTCPDSCYAAVKACPCGWEVIGAKL